MPKKVQEPTKLMQATVEHKDGLGTILTFPEVKPSEEQINFWMKFDESIRILDTKQITAHDRITAWGSRFAEGTSFFNSPSALVGMIAHAYSKHLPVSLRPDDIWLCILYSLGLYVNKHSEEMRAVFVDFTGKRDLEINLGPGSLAQDEADAEHWARAIQMMTAEIGKNTKGEWAAWVEPQFSTTLDSDRFAARVSLMSALQTYFSYSMQYMCGLPRVVLRGTLDDWKQLRAKAGKLEEMKNATMSKWARTLLPVLDKLVDSYSGIVDANWWQCICKNENLGSGGNVTSGWVRAFAPFDFQGVYNLDGKYATRDEFPVCGCTVPVKILDDAGEHAALFCAGITQVSMDTEASALAGNAGWGMVLLDPKVKRTKPETRQDIMDYEEE